MVASVNPPFLFKPAVSSSCSCCCLTTARLRGGLELTPGPVVDTLGASCSQARSRSTLSDTAPVMGDTRPAFSIERILGLGLETPGDHLELHRPWAGERRRVTLWSMMFINVDLINKETHFLFCASCIVITIFIIICHLQR